MRMSGLGMPAEALTFRDATITSPPGLPRIPFSSRTPPEFQRGGPILGSIPLRKESQMLQWKALGTNKVLLTVAALSAFGVIAVGGTYANFTATPTTISNNAFASGSLTMSRSGSGAVLSASAMKIGDSTTGSVTITNTGSLAAV